MLCRLDALGLVRQDRYRGAVLTAGGEAVSLDMVRHHRRLETYATLRRIMAETPSEQIRPHRLLTGDNLQEMGYRPGPIFREILSKVEDATLEGQIQTEEEARDYVRRHFAPAHSRVRASKKKGRSSGRK